MKIIKSSLQPEERGYLPLHHRELLFVLCLLNEQLGGLPIWQVLASSSNRKTLCVFNFQNCQIWTNRISENKLHPDYFELLHYNLKGDS